MMWNKLRLLAASLNHFLHTLGFWAVAGFCRVWLPLLCVLPQITKVCSQFIKSPAHTGLEKSSQTDATHVNGQRLEPTNQTAAKLNACTNQQAPKTYTTMGYQQLGMQHMGHATC
jgi:hypothetical protein